MSAGPPPARPLPAPSRSRPGRPPAEAAPGPLTLSGAVPSRATGRDRADRLGVLFLVPARRDGLVHAADGRHGRRSRSPHYGAIFNPAQASNYDELFAGHPELADHLRHHGR